MENNIIELFGKVVGEITLNHEIKGEKFYSLFLEVERLSSIKDTLEVIISEKLLFDIQEGTYVDIKGEIRTYNQMVENRNKLLITVFVKTIQVVTDPATIKESLATNNVQLRGFVCKKPLYRLTPFGKQISDILLAVNRRFLKSDYIPCIAWGRNAAYSDHFEVGKEIELVGRLQSREYTKYLEDGTTEIRTAYEVSILNITAVEE